MNSTTTSRPAPGSNVPDIPHGLAEQLARIARFRAFEQVQPEELDFVALWLLGPVGDSQAKWELWEQIQDDCNRLWFLITDDWDDRDLDELTEADCTRLDLTATEGQIEDLRYELTRARLCHDIEHQVWLARYRAAEAQRTAVAR